MVKLAPSSVTWVVITTNSGQSTSTETILTSSLQTETSLGSGNVNAPLGEFSPCNDFQPHGFGSNGVLGQTLSMNTQYASPVAYAELPVEARALLFIFALGAAARYMGQPPNQSELTPILEAIWNRNRLCRNDLSNPFRMTALLESELLSVCLAGGVQ
jgi:hypothetical protein